MSNASQLVDDRVHHDATTQKLADGVADVDRVPDKAIDPSAKLSPARTISDKPAGLSTLRNRVSTGPPGKAIPDG
jgi:hypothetical protein